MKKSIKDKWLKALRSGEYIQGHDVLRNDDNEFCCLGVLCDLYSKEKKIEWGLDLYFLGELHTLPEEVIEWAGLKVPNPKINKMPLSDYNDGIRSLKPKSFKQIASLISKYL